METSLQLVTHWQSAQSPRPPQHPIEAPVCFYTLRGSSFKHFHWSISLLLEPPAHTQARVGLTLHSNRPSTTHSTRHPCQVQPLVSFLPPAKGIQGSKDISCSQCYVIIRCRNMVMWFSKEAVPSLNNTISGAVLSIRSFLDLFSIFSLKSLTFFFSYLLFLKGCLVICCTFRNIIIY